MKQEEVEKYSMMLHNDCLEEFNQQFYKGVITKEHLTGKGAINIKKVVMPNGTTDEDFNFWGWQLERGGDRWLLPNRDSKNNLIQLSDVLPLKPTKWDEVAAEGKVYKLIIRYNIIKPRAEKKIEFRQLVDILSCTPHENPKHKKLLTMIALSSIISRCYFRLSSPPGFGKDSIVDTMGYLVGSCSTIENPSKAKIEREASLARWTGLNEVVGLSPANWRDIGKFILAATAFKNSINKSTRAFGGVEETINLKHFSMTIFYNDNDCYRDSKVVYFDELAEDGILDRLPAIRFYGKYSYDFNKIHNIDVASFVTSNYELYKDIIYSITYYKESFDTHNPFKGRIKGVSQRWNRSLGILLRVISLYVESEAEYNAWLKVLEQCILDYKAMIVLPKMMSTISNNRSVMKKLNEKFISMNTFTDKVSLVDRALRGEDFSSEPISDLKIWN